MKELKKEFLKNQAKIERSRKLTKEERVKLIKRNREILNIMNKSKEVE